MCAVISNTTLIEWVEAKNSSGNATLKSTSNRLTSNSSLQYHHGVNFLVNNAIELQTTYCTLAGLRSFIFKYLAQVSFLRHLRNCYVDGIVEVYNSPI